MGLKSKLQQARRRAEREGRLEDAVYLEGLISDLIKARGDAAYARAQNTRTYDVKPGDTFFSVAEEELGSVDWAPELVAANEGILQLHPGIVLHLPEVGEESGLEAFEMLQEAETKAAYAGQGRADELREAEEAEQKAITAEQDQGTVDRDVALEQKTDFLGLTQEQEETLLQTLEQELPKWLEEWGLGGFGPAAAESAAGAKVDGRPAQQGEDPPEPQDKGGDLAYLERWHEYTLEQLQNSEPTSSAEIIEQMNRYYRLRSKIEQGEITQQDLEGWGYFPPDTSKVSATPTPLRESGVLSSSDPSSHYLELHRKPLEYPDELGGFSFYTRFEWGARDLVFRNETEAEGKYDPGREWGYLVYSEPLDDVYHTIVIHDTGVSRDQYGGTNIEMVQSTQMFHQAVPQIDENGNPIEATGSNNADIGYHFVITPDGSIFEGRDLRARGAHVAIVTDENDNPIVGNTGSLGIALIGNDELEEPTAEQLAALDALAEYLLTELPNLGCVAGHGTVNPDLRENEGVAVAQALVSSNPALKYGNCYPAGH